MHSLARVLGSVVPYLLILSFTSISHAQGESETEVLERIGKLEKTVEALTKRVNTQKSQLNAFRNRFQRISQAARPPVIKKKTSAGLTRKEMAQALKNPEEHRMTYRTVPYFRNGKVLGPRIFAIKSDSILKKFGLQNGDVLISVDGKAIGSAKKLERLLFAKTNSKFRSLKIDRADQRVELKVPIKNE